MGLTIISVIPLPDATGITRSQQVIVEFSEEIDRDSINSGTFVVATSSNKVVGQDPLFHDWAQIESLVTQNLLESPNFSGLIAGTLTFSDDLLTVTFTPDASLDKNTQYLILLSKSILTKTIGDIVPNPANTGNGDLDLIGPYTGSNDDLVIEIITGGGLKTGTFQWWYASDPTTKSSVITLDRLIKIEDGLTIMFAAGAYDAGDQWTCPLIEGVGLTDLYSWSFTTSDAEGTNPPGEESVQLTDVVVDGSTLVQPVSIPSVLSVVSTTPSSRAINQLVDLAEITVEFSASLDPTTLSGITIKSQQLTTEIEPLSTQTAVPFTATASGSTLTLLLSEEFEENQLVTVLLSGIKSLTGLELTYTWYFTTLLDPIYSTVDRIRLEVGPWISTILDDTINQLIHKHSIRADALNFTGFDVTGTSDAVTLYKIVRSDYVTCRTILDLLMGGSKGGANQKRLGDLSVSTNTSDKGNLLDRFLNCATMAEKALTDGGFYGVQVSSFIKSANDPNAPLTGRGWYDVASDEIPGANSLDIDGRFGARTFTERSTRGIPGVFQGNKNKLG